MYVLKRTTALSGAFALIIALNAILPAYYGAGRLSVASALAVAASVTLLVFVFGRRVSARLKDAEQFIEKLTEGDTTARLRSRRDDLDGLRSQLNRLSEFIKANEARRNDLIAAIPAAVIQLDATGSIARLNGFAAMLTGHSAIEVPEMDYTDITPTQSHHEMKEVFKAVSNGGTVTGRVITILGDDCREITCEFNAVPLWKGSEADGCVLMFRDVDEKKRLETELKSAWMKAEEASAKLDKTIQCLEEFSLMAVRRELKMREIRERLNELKKDTDLKKDPFDRSA